MQNVVIHCGEGYGRTGTVLSGIKLMSTLEQKYAENPDFTESYSLDADKEIDLGHYSDIDQINCTQGVLEAITSVRRGIQTGGKNLNTDGSSVENEQQLGSLVKLEKSTIQII